MAAPGKVRDSYPFSKAREGENVWLTGEAVIAIGDIVQRGNPIPDPNTYEFIQRTSEGVHFGLVSPIISDQSPSSSSMSQSKTAIVPVEAGYLKWHCEERPDVIFRDCVSVPVGADGSATVVVPDLFVQSVAMDSLKLASVVPCGGAAAVEVSRTVDGWSFTVRESWWRRWVSGRRVTELVVSFEAIRLGFEKVRYEFATRAEYEANERFYRCQRP